MNDIFMKPDFTCIRFCANWLIYCWIKLWFPGLTFKSESVIDKTYSFCINCLQPWSFHVPLVHFLSDLFSFITIGMKLEFSYNCFSFHGGPSPSRLRACFPYSQGRVSHRLRQEQKYNLNRHRSKLQCDIDHLDNFREKENSIQSRPSK